MGEDRISGGGGGGGGGRGDVSGGTDGRDVTSILAVVET